MIRHGEITIQKLSKKPSVSLKPQIAAVAALAAEIWRGHYTPIIGAAQVEYMLAKFQSAEQIYKEITENECTYFIATQKDRDILTGYCAVQPQEDCLLLSKLYILDGFRGRGIARRFMDEVTSLCQEHGLNKIRLTVNKNNSNAVAAYRKMGFETVDSVKVGIGGGFYMDDYVMAFALPQTPKSFKPVANKNSRLLILGTMPSVQSRKANF
jgi:ribosomal protein S18 acetylase RimI-like enzyme